jgi:hypothetical protein
LGTVVQVAFDPASFGQSRRQHPRAALGQLLHALGEPGASGRTQQRPSQGDVRLGETGDQEIPGERNDRQGDDRDDQRFGQSVDPDLLPQWSTLRKRDKQPRGKRDRTDREHERGDHHNKLECTYGY